jgi:hypothetical protein
VLDAGQFVFAARLLLRDEGHAALISTATAWHFRSLERTVCAGTQDSAAKGAKATLA